MPTKNWTQKSKKNFADSVKEGLCRGPVSRPLGKGQNPNYPRAAWAKAQITISSLPFSDAAAATPPARRTAACRRRAPARPPSAAARAPWPRARPPAARPWQRARSPPAARARLPPEKFPLFVSFLAAALLIPAAGGAALLLAAVRCSYWLALARLGLGLALHGTWLCARNRGEQRAAAASHGMTNVRSESASYRRRDAPAPSKLHVRSGRGSGEHGSGVRQACSGRP